MAVAAGEAGSPAARGELRAPAPAPICAPGAATSWAVEVDGLSKRFGRRDAVSEASIRVPHGCAFGFLGPNGAGKTTVIRMLLGLTRPTAGRIRILGHDIPAERQVALRRVGAVVEEPRFHPFLTGRENLRIIAAARERESAGRIDASLARVGLAERGDDRVKSYSLGMRQRLGIARCLVADPRLLILDEPMNGLDPAGIAEFRVLVGSLVDEGITVFVSSHLLDEIEKTCQYVAVIDQGHITYHGPLADVGQRSSLAAAIDCDSCERAAAILHGHPAIAGITSDGGTTTMIVTLTARAAAEPEAAYASINRMLVQAGLAVSRIEPLRDSLEQRFLAMTTRLQEPPPLAPPFAPVPALSAVPASASAPSPPVGP
jgi:ABC-2 type transport system ATP-binding protein